MSQLKYMPIYRCALVREGHAGEQLSLTSPQIGAKLFWEMAKEADREQIMVAMLDTKNRVIGVNVVAVGTLDSALCHPREVFKAAILCNAAAILVGHNHPSSDPTPSAEDRRVTQRLAEAGKLLQIEVLDHIIVGGPDRYVSLKERGML